MANKRILTLGFFLALAWLGMLLRVAYVQVIQSDHYQAMAYSQSVRRNVVAPKRGEILDRDLQKLVVNADVELESGAEGKYRSLDIKLLGGYTYTMPLSLEPDLVFAMGKV